MSAIAERTRTVVKRSEKEMLDEIELSISGALDEHRPVVADSVRRKVVKFAEQGTLGLRLARAYVRWAIEHPLEVGREQMKTCRCEAGMIYYDDGTAKPCARCLGIDENAPVPEPPPEF